MGIQGLLPLLKSIQKPTHLRNFAGQTLGIDAYGWLHRGTVACAIELALQKPTRKHIDFALSRVRMLLYFGVKPYLVFDGDYLPSKAHTEKERALRRKESKQAGLEYLQMGRLPQAHLELQKAVDVTPSMARELIEELRRLNVPYVVAPYEADSQLAYLEKRGEISGVISEDSDLLVFGIKRLLTKLDQYGEVVMVSRSDFTACREISLVGWSDHEFRMMAMLSGCDYLPGINNTGLKTAYRYVRKYKTLERVVQMLQFEGKRGVPPDYIENFTRAERTFLYQWVFCPQAQKLVHLTPLPSDLDIENMSYLGHPVEADVAKAVAAGDLDPNTKQRLILTTRHALSGTRTVSVHTPDPKQGKPITAFFKARRTPLSELDPNSFTPSPSQQRLLQQQQTISWSASRAPTTSRIALQSVPASAPQAGRRVLSEQGSNGLRASPKRQRLCSDSILAQSMQGDIGLKSTASPFFSQDIAGPKSSTRKAPTQSRHESFQLWSDQAIADAVAEVDAAHEVVSELKGQAPRKRKKLAMYADVEEEAFKMSASANVSQATVSMTGQSPPTALESLECQSRNTVFSNGIEHDFTSLKSRFMHQTAVRSSNTRRTKSAPMPLRAPLQDLEHITPSECLAEAYDSPPRTGRDQDGETVVPCSSPVPKCHGEADHDGVADDKWLSLEPRRASPDATLLVLGSEDFLVPNSPSDEGADGRLRPKLDLGRFVFAG